VKILVIEDERTLSDSIIQYLQHENYICEPAHTYEEGLEKILEHHYDCIILDIMLPDGNGLKLLEALKQEQKLEGVIIISAKNSLDDRVKGLNLGADDYLAKPFHLPELSARVSAIIRRKLFRGRNVITLHELELDLNGRTFTVHQKPVELTRKEYDLLVFLVSNKNRVVSKNAIAEHLSGDFADNFDNYDIIYAHIKNLKRKLQEAGSNDYLKTVYGLGYKFEI
jgi:DNA-binding response OmpR family regulator